ncbi:MAG: hypothetical protein QOG62_469 [Thermoleophilaceae bacterium]|jgi:hypothetical protein|nr:hypothetical protein [Thermoleophilaceae bacterium]
MREDETKEERLDRNLIELLNELRVVLPGVQVLFAFLLVAPFNSRFAETTAFERYVYLGTLLATALSAILLMAPSAHHRIRFRDRDKEFIVVMGNRLAVLGLISIATAMCGVVLLVTTVVFEPPISVACTAGVAVAFLGLWFLIPALREFRKRPDSDAS